MAPFWNLKSPKIPPKSDPKRHRNFDRFLLRFFVHFGSLLGANLGPCWPPFSRQDGPRRPREAPGSRPGNSRESPGKPSAHGADGVPHFWPPGPMGYPIFGRFLEPIWYQFGAILGHFGARGNPGWAGGVTRSAKNFQEIDFLAIGGACAIFYDEFAHLVPVQK